MAFGPGQAGKFGGYSVIERPCKNSARINAHEMGSERSADFSMFCRICLSEMLPKSFAISMSASSYVDMVVSQKRDANMKPAKNVKVLLVCGNPKPYTP